MKYLQIAFAVGNPLIAIDRDEGGKEEKRKRKGRKGEKEAREKKKKE